MSTHVTTRNPVRSDLGDTTSTTAPTSKPSRAWAVAGIAAGVAGIASGVFSSMVNAIYDRDLVGDTDGIFAKLVDQTVQMQAFHFTTTLTAVLMVVFGAGLYRRLKSTASADSISPLVAFGGLLGTAVVLTLGSGLDTEFMMGVGQEDLIEPVNAIMYNHWVGTISWVWMLAGLAGLAIHQVAKAGGAPRWLGRVGLVLGGLTVLLGISPVQYMASMTGQIWLLVTALGFYLGDKQFRRG